MHLCLAAVHPEGDNQAQRAAVAGKAGVTRHFPSCGGLLDGENHFNEVVLVVCPVVKYAVAQSCAYQYAEEAIEEKRFEFLFVYFAVAVLVLHDKVGKSEADNP